MVIGQSPNYQFTKLMNKEQNQVVKTAFEIKQNILVVKRIEDNKTDFVLDVLDSNYMYVSSQSFKLPVTKIRKMGVIQNQLVVFGEFENGSLDILKMFVFDNTYSSFVEKELMSLDARGGYRTNYDVSISPSGKYFSMIGSHAYKEKHKEIMSIAMYDSLQNKVFSDDILTTIESSKRRHNVLVCNDNGYNYIIKKERSKNKNNYYLYTVNSTGTKQHETVRLKSRQIVDAEYSLDAAGNLFLAGFFSSPISFNFEGLFVAKYEEKASATFTREYFFNANVVEAFRSKKEIKEYGFGLDYFSAKGLLFTSEKDMILMAEHHSVLKDAKNGPEDYRRGFVMFNLDVNGGFKYGTPVVTEQTDGKTMGYWSSNYMISFEGKPVVYINRIGDGAKSTKSSAQKNSGLPVESMVFANSGNFESSYPDFEMEMLQFCLNTNFKNKTSKTIICFERLDRKAYTFGILKSIDG